MKLISQRLRRWVSVLCSLGMLSPGSLLMASTAAPREQVPAAGGRADAPASKAVLVRGTAHWTTVSGQHGLVLKDMTLPDGVTLRTRENAVVKLRLHDGNELILGPNSQITLDTLKKKGSWVNQISFFGGRLRGMVHKLSHGDRMEILTTNAVAAVKGTDFIMELAPLPDLPKQAAALPPAKDAVHARAARHLLGRLPLVLRWALLASPAWSAESSSNNNLKVTVLSSTAIGMYLASKNGKTGVQVPAGGKALMSPLGTVAAGQVTLKDVAAANDASQGAAPAVVYEPKLAKVQLATEAKLVMLEAMDAQLSIVQNRQAEALAAVVAAKGADAPAVAQLKEAQAAQAQASQEYLTALTVGVQKMADLDAKLQEAISSGQPTEELLAQRDSAEASMDSQTSALIQKVDEANQAAQSAVETALPDAAPGLPAPAPQGPAVPAGPSLAQLAQQTLQQVQQEQARQAQQDQQSVKNDLYTGSNYVDRNNVRVQVSRVVLRPDAATVQRIQFTERTTGPQAGQSIFSHSVTFNKALPEDWTVVVDRDMNDSANLGTGSPNFYKLSEQVAMRSPAACQLCLTEQYDVPQQLSGVWKQGVTERTAVQGADFGYVHYDASGAVLAGSDDISVAVTENVAENNWQFTYTNNTLGLEMFTARVWLIDGLGGFTDTATFAGGPLTSLRSFNLGFEGKFFELAVTAPAFNGQEIDVVLPSPAFLSAFKKGN